MFQTAEEWHGKAVIRGRVDHVDSESSQPAAVRNRERAQQKTVDHGKNCGVGAHAESERHQRDEGESWRLAQDAEGEARVARKIFEGAKLP